MFVMLSRLASNWSDAEGSSQILAWDRPATGATSFAALAPSVAIKVTASRPTMNC